jgi:outer membrane cobalamin receptor
MLTAQITGGVTGRVEDAETGKPLIGANIIIKSTPYGTATDLQGVFNLKRLPAGQYTLEASMMGYQKASRPVVVTAGRVFESLFQLEPTVLKQRKLVVTATRRKQYIEDAPTSVEVVNDHAIRTRGASELDEILENTTGFSIIDGQVDIRGSTGFNWTAGSRVLVMVDGTPFINGDSQGISWDAIPVELVDHVEIVKGAGSALYGSNAMAGVINIITKEPSPAPKTFFKLNWGFYDKPAYSEWIWTDRFFSDRFRPFDGKIFPKNTLSYEGLDISHSRLIGPVGMLITLGRQRNAGYTQNGDFSRWNSMAKLNFRISPQMVLTTMGVWGRLSHGDIIQWKSQAEAMEVPREELGNRILNEKGHVQANLNHVISSRFAYTLKTNFYRSHWQDYFYDNEDYSITDRYGIELQGDYFRGIQALTFGGEFIAYHADASIYVRDFAFYLEDELHFTNLLTVILGARYDHHTVVNTSSDQQFSPRLGMVIKPLEYTSIRLSGGYGFRAPSIAEVFANTSVSGFRVVPNPGLKDADRAWNAELGIHQLLGLSPAYSRYKNMIDVDINPEVMAFQFVTAGNARIQGFEMSLQTSFFNGMFQTHLGYTLLDPRDLETDKLLKYRSRHRLLLGAQLRLWRFMLGWDYRFASEIEEVVNVFYGDERVPMHVMDGRLIFDAGPVQINFEVRNFRNYHYTLRQRFLEPVRSYTLTLRGML